MADFRPTAEPLEARELLSVSAAPAPGANPVIAWNALALEAIRLDKTTPPAASRDLAILQASVYDAVNSVKTTGAPYHVRLPAAPGTSVDAAAVGAAHEALVHLFPDQVALFDLAYAQSVAVLPKTPGTTSGLALGVKVADQELAARAADGSSAEVSYTPLNAPGFWRPTPPAYAPALLPQWVDLTPFVLQSGSQFRAPQPPLLNSSGYAAGLVTVGSLGAKNSTTRTADQTQVAYFWSDGSGTETPPGHWNAIAEGIATARHDSTVKSARVFALLDLALADAAIACWDSKFAYDFWRPITAMRQINPTWTPLLTTPPFPSYTSGHSTFSGAAAAVLSSVYGRHFHFTTTSDGLPGVTRSYPSFAAAAAEAGISRIYGGIHYPFDNTAGLALGQNVGQYVLAHALRPHGHG